MALMKLDAGTHMAEQGRLISCRISSLVLALFIKFFAGPLAMAIICFIVGLRGDVLRVAIIQVSTDRLSANRNCDFHHSCACKGLIASVGASALPKSMTSFMIAKEYGLHADVISTAKKERPEGAVHKFVFASQFFLIFFGYYTHKKGVERMALVQAKETCSMSYQVPTLTATNYPIWAIKVKSIFDTHGLLETVEPRALGEEPDAKKSKQALPFLFQAIPEDIVLQMSSHTDPKKVWDVLKS
ncbi:hypothetical protein E3N88_01314 [Mikania micrantha]|uniref:DUF4219 domain-containing protein n=1 Tax=Mikania micrantha TaxID=192012 RepID=A0A5N6Q2W8_9ASTR|nr:hypothetical protein E3N88_01314 [Mikania micrantha]